MSSGDKYLSELGPEELRGRSDELTAVRDRLVELGAADVATELDEVLSAIADYDEPDIENYRAQVERRMAKIADVLRAVEREGSGDGRQVEEAVTRYRAGID
ncbi:hypothetical protein NLM24_05395 [Nocardia zapadnayensis]|uniref:hypothetical protein n=1 Tax=Nocardia rhamnosiphila TaxID=426716 RepID=UPI0022451F10|nr:hypothetical protein [Nocardia zapadnayensis]MCX0270148.1 hypothetical protein [Nocardia zapadnayensis]